MKRFHLVRLKWEIIARLGRPLELRYFHCQPSSSTIHDHVKCRSGYLSACQTTVLTHVIGHFVSVHRNTNKKTQLIKKKLYSPKDIQFFLHNFAIYYTFTACEKKAIIIFSLFHIFTSFFSNNFHDHAALEICKGIFSILCHTHEFCKFLLFFLLFFLFFF